MTFVDLDMRLSDGQGVVEVADDLVMEGWLVGFDGEQIVSVPLGDGGGDAGVAGDGIDGDKRAVEGHAIEQFGNDGAFIAFGVDRLLGQHQALVGGPDGDEVQRAVPAATIVATPRGLAIDGDQRRGIGAQRQGPVGEARLKQCRVDAVHHRPQPVGAWRAEMKLAETPQKSYMRHAPRRDLVVVLTVGDGRSHDHEQDFIERVAHFLWYARVLDRPKVIQ
jgi:hypothetical protein